MFNRSRRDRGEYGWELGKGWRVCCRAPDRDGLFRAFAESGGIWRDAVLDSLGVPGFLRASSEEELLLKLEVFESGAGQFQKAF